MKEAVAVIDQFTPTAVAEAGQRVLGSEPIKAASPIRITVNDADSAIFGGSSGSSGSVIRR